MSRRSSTVNDVAKSHHQARNNLFSEYSSAQPQSMSPQHGLELPEQAEVCLLFEEYSCPQRGLEGRGLVYMSKPLQGKISWSWRHEEPLEQKGRINGTIGSNLHSRALSKGLGSVFPLEFVSKWRLSDHTFNDLIPNGLKRMCIHIWTSHYPVGNVSQSRIRCEGWAGCKLYPNFLEIRCISFDARLSWVFVLRTCSQWWARYRQNVAPLPLPLHRQKCSAATATATILNM